MRSGTGSTYPAPLLFFFVTLLLVGLLLPAPIPAQDGHPLTGTVHDREDRPVVGVSVVVKGPVSRSTVTEAGGAFAFAALPAGEYTIVLEGIGYRGVQETVTVRPGMTPIALEVDATPVLLEPIRVVSIVRGDRPATSLPMKIAVIETELLRTEQTLAANPTELLANLIPSFSPGRQKLTSSGESFRGRRPLFLIDGVPQSNPLRDGRRDGFTIGMDVIDRVEVVFGANAIQGLGATGGIVNYVTVSPPSSGATEQRLSLSTTTNDGFETNSTGVRGHYLVGKDFGSTDVVGSFTWERRGLQFDAEGRPIAIDNVQGDIADSGSRNIFLKGGWEPADNQRLQLTINDFRLAQDGDFVSIPGDRSAGMPATSEGGEPEGVQPINDVTTVSAEWRHEDLFSGTFSAQAYGQDFSALYGGGVFGVFQDPDLAPVGELFEQSENNSEKLGARMSWAGRPTRDLPLDLVTGMDLLRDRTFQRLVQTDRKWVPETTFWNYAPFVQADVEPTPAVTLSAGLRWEVARLNVPDFSTIAGNRADYQSVTVEGGSPSFHEPLLNVGAVVRPADGFRLYGTFAQAFTMPDVGRVLRGISEEGTSVEEFLDLQPVETDNLEVGADHATDRTRIAAAWFQSDAELGSRLVPNADGIFQVTRQPTRTTGVELSGRFDPSRSLSFRAGYSTLKGTFDGDGDGELESDLGASNIGPDRLNLGVEINRGGTTSGTLRFFHYFGRSFRDGAGDVTADFDGYSTVDASVGRQVGPTTLTLAVSNLLDEQYITYFGQAATSRDDRYFAGRGRTITLRVDGHF